MVRDNLPDAVRGSLMLLVVWGHLLESKGFNGSLYFSIYVFHMPAFAMISGMFSKPRLDAIGMVKIFKHLLIPLVFFQIAYFLAFGVFAPGRASSIFIPAWIIWFLFSLITWKLLLPLALRLPCPFLLSVFAALIAGLVDEIGAAFSLSRTFVFFPAFLFGHLYGKRILGAVRDYRISLCVLFLMLFSASFFVSGYVNVQLLWGSRAYSEIPLETPGVLYRVVAIAVGISASVAFFAMVPSRSKALAYLGRNTMPIYLLHGFFVMFFWSSGSQLESNMLFVLLTAVLSLVISFSLARIGRVLPV